MKFLYFCIGIFAVSLCSAQQQQGTAKGQIVTQTRSSTTTGGTAAQTTTGTGTGVSTAPTAGTTTGTGTGVLVTPSTAVPSQTADQLLSGTNATVGNTPILQNTTNLFGQVVGVTTNTGAIGTNAAGGGAALAVGGGTVAQQAAAGVTAPGFTQIMITLQGTVQSETDRQAILNRFQNIPGFTVVDQLQIANPGALPGATVNEAAGAESSGVIVQPTTP